MNEERTTETILRGFVFPILLVVFLFQAYACRALYADGASFLLFVLQEHDFPRWDMQRMANHVVTLGPTLLALKLGVRDLVFLRYLFSSWILFLPYVRLGRCLMDSASRYFVLAFGHAVLSGVLRDEFLRDW